MKIKNIYKALCEQGPIKRAWRNFIITGNAWGMFYRNSHISMKSGKPKIKHVTKEEAERTARSMERMYLKKHKKETHFSSYKCVFCDGYHIGKNRDNK